MQLILLSGGSGKRLWPLSNDARSKQFLPLLSSPSGKRESMIQRVMRQIESSKLGAKVTIATNAGQRDSIISQLGKNVSIVLEPERRDTFPAIALSSSYLSLSKGCSDEEVVVVMPCDVYTESGYFDTIGRMANAVSLGAADLVLMGVEPSFPSEKFGYIVPKITAGKGKAGDCIPVSSFVEKPNYDKAVKLLAEQAMWNGGVFAFRLGYLMNVIRRYLVVSSFKEIVDRYSELPKISFDYEVVEKAQSVAVIRYEGLWKDLGTWNSLCDEMPVHYSGKVIPGPNCNNVHVINELNLPLFIDGVSNVVVAACADGIMVSGKKESEKIKDYSSQLISRPMYEERRWGTYEVLDSVSFPSGQESLTKTITLHAGKNISYQLHHYRSEVWTIVNGEGVFVLDGEKHSVKPGDVLIIPVGRKHTIRAVTELTFIEVQTGKPLIEEDIERFTYNWGID